MAVYSFEGLTPVVDPLAYVHPTAVLIGDVIIGPGTYIGPGASLRGDFGRIIVERGANVQDCCVMHGYPGADTIVAENAAVGHGAVVHSARIGANALIGMNAVVNDNAVIGEWSVVAAMSFVRAEMVVPPRTLVAGIPARIVRELTATERAWKEVGEERLPRAQPARAHRPGRGRAARRGRAGPASPRMGRGESALGHEARGIARDWARVVES